MNINQMQNFEQADSLKQWKENIDNVKIKAEDSISKLEKDPEKKAWIVNWIKEKLLPKKENNDEQPETNESYKQEIQEEERVIGNQWWADLNKKVEAISQ